jgi:hypothetical protein
MTAVFVLNWEGGSDKRQVVIHTVYFKLISFKSDPSIHYFCNQSSNPTVAGTSSNGSSLLMKHF